ncbi:hypothetical protein ACRC7T_18025 (plasmid) [Segnochrobactraceae bacterium EtOH-i3]
MPEIDRIRAVIKSKSIRRVIMTNYTMGGIGGSQLVLYDIASVLIAAGAEVTVVSPIVDEPMATLMASIGVSIINISDPRNINKIPESTDLIWGLHWPVVGMLIFHYEINYKYLILSSLSPYEPIESLSFMTEHADVLLVNSIENLEHHRKLTGNAAFTKRITIFPNSLPLTWFQDAQAPAKVLRRILFVSNRKSARIEIIKNTLKTKGMEIIEIGSGKTEKLVDIELIDSCDAVVTIGHTVQKAMARKKPVFIFDRFGGQGWVMNSNIDILAKFNFSGRGSSFINSLDAAKNIIDKYETASYESEVIFSLAKERFSLELNLGNILSSLSSEKEVRKNIGESAFSILRASQAFFSVRFPKSIDPVRLAPGGSMGTMELLVDLPDQRGNGIFFRIAEPQSDAVVFGSEADFVISGGILAEDGSHVVLRAERNDGIIFTLNSFINSQWLVAEYPSLPVARKSGFQFNLVADVVGSNFVLTAEENGKIHSLGKITAKKISK